MSCQSRLGRHLVSSWQWTLGLKLPASEYFGQLCCCSSIHNRYHCGFAIYCMITCQAIHTCSIFGSLSLAILFTQVQSIHERQSWSLFVNHHCMQHSLICAQPAQCIAAPHRKIVNTRGTRVSQLFNAMYVCRGGYREPSHYHDKLWASWSPWWWTRILLDREGKQMCCVWTYGQLY